MNGVEKTVTPLLEVVNGVQTYVYTVSGITADVTIKVNKAVTSSNLTIGSVSYSTNQYTVNFQSAKAITPAFYQVVIGNIVDTGKVANSAAWAANTDIPATVAYAAVSGTFENVTVTVTAYDANGNVIATGSAVRSCM